MDETTNERCEKLMVALAEGDESVVEELVRLTRDTILGCASDVLGTKDENALLDVAQEVWLRMIQAAPTYRRDRGARFETWLRMIVIGKARDARRAAARRKFKRLAAGDEPAARVSVDVLMINEEAEKALEVLKDEDDRLAFVLKRRDGFSYDEIAQMMGHEEVNAAAWKTRILRAGETVLRAAEARTRR